jgi:integrase
MKLAADNRVHWLAECAARFSGRLFLHHAKGGSTLTVAIRRLRALTVGWHSFRHTYRTLIDDIGTPLGVQQRLMRHPDIKTTMNTYGSAFEKTKRRANSRVADLVLPPAIKKQLKDRAKEVSLKNLRPQTAAIQ